MLENVFFIWGYPQTTWKDLWNFDPLPPSKRTEGRLNLNFLVHPYGGGFFESLKHAKISYKNIEFKNRL